MQKKSESTDGDGVKERVKRLFRLFGKKPLPYISVVSGLPRSGTSLAMKMLEVGGIPVLTDNIRTADGDNPRGYYEYEPVKTLPDGTSDWLAHAEGKVVKVVSSLLPYLPETYCFRILLMQRNMSEVLASQKKMLIHRGENPDEIDDEELSSLFAVHLKQTEQWLERHQHHVAYIKISYNDLLENPSPVIATINRFLGGSLLVDRMEQVVETSLYRNRHEEIATR